MSDDPFRVLGLGRGASADDVRAARRSLARRHHPDAGGDADAMRAVNVAAAEALRRLAGGGAGGRADDRRAPTDPAPAPSEGPHGGARAPSEPGGHRVEWTGVTSDVPSFTVEALPAATHEALLLAAAELGEVEDDEPPYLLRALLADPVACWCQLEVVPDAGASTVGVTIAPVEGRRPPSIVDVRDAWIAVLNALDWSEL